MSVDEIIEMINKEEFYGDLENFIDEHCEELENEKIEFIQNMKIEKCWYGWRMLNVYTINDYYFAVLENICFRGEKSRLTAYRVRYKINHEFELI